MKEIFPALFALFLLNATLSWLYNTIYQLFFPPFLILAGIAAGSLMGIYFYWRRLRFFWIVLLFASLSALILFNMAFWRLQVLEGHFSALLYKHSLHTILFVVFATALLQITFFRFRIARLFISLGYFLALIPILLKFFDGSFLWRWEEYTIMISWLLFGVFQLLLLTKIEKLRFFSSFWLQLAFLAILTIFSLNFFISKKSALSTNNLRAEKNSFHFDPFLSLYPKVSLSQDRIMIAEMRSGRHIRHIILSGFSTEELFFQDRENKFSDYPPPLREKQTTAWSKEKSNFANLPDSAMFQQKFFLKKFSPSANIGVLTILNIRPFEVKTPDRFQAILQVDSFLSYPAKKGSADFISYYTHTGSSHLINRIKKLAITITAAEPNPQQQIELLRQYFAKNFIYSLQPGGEQIQNRLEYFLFENKKGYCTYFAFSLALMARTLGIPARVAVGFLPDVKLSKLQYWWILAAHAHAWVEIWFPDQGWITVDVPVTRQERPITIPQILNLQQEIRSDLLAIEKNIHNSPLQEKNFNTAKKSNPSTLLTFFNEKNYILFLFIFLLTVRQVWFLYRFLLLAMIRPSKKNYYLFHHEIWSLRRLAFNRQKGQDWLAWLPQILPIMKDEMRLLEILWERSTSDIMDKKKIEVIIIQIRKQRQSMVRRLPLWKRTLAAIQPLWLRPGNHSIK